MSHKILKVHDAKRVLINHGYCEALAVQEVGQRSDGNEGIQLWFRSNGAAWDEGSPVHVFYADEATECPPIAEVLLSLSVNDAEALVEILMSYKGVRAARNKRCSEGRKAIFEKETAELQKLNGGKANG